MGPTLRSAVLSAAALAALAPPFFVPAHARQDIPPRPIDRVLRQPPRIINRRALEEDLRRQAGLARERQRLAVAQIREDYVRIQIAKGEMEEAAAQPGGLDLKLVAKSASEIRRRAARLRNNLALPDAPEDERHAGATPTPPAGREELKASMLALGGLVERFVRNPIFREVNVLDAKASARARRDLEEIVELSGRLKKDCEKFARVSR